MKRVAILAAVLLSGAAFAAEQWNAEQIAQKKTEAAAAKSAWLRASINAEIAVKGGTAPGSYAEIEQRCIAAYGAENISADYGKVKACQLVCFGYPEFTVDAYKVAKIQKNVFWWRFVLNKNTPLVLSDEQKFSELAECMLSGCEKDPKNVQKVIGEMLCYTSAVDDAAAKKVLTDLNRYFSAKLALDKAAWEPVVAQLRTVLATY